MRKDAAARGARPVTKKRAPRRKPQLSGAVRPSARDERLEAARVDVAEGRRRADHDRGPEGMSAEHVDERHAALRPATLAGGETGFGEDGRCARAIDEGAHPPRGSVMNAGQREKRLSEPGGDLGHPGGLANRGERVFAAEIDREGGAGRIARRLEADVARRCRRPAAGRRRRG